MSPTCSVTFLAHTIYCLQRGAVSHLSLAGLPTGMGQDLDLFPLNWKQIDVV